MATGLDHGGDVLDREIGKIGHHPEKLGGARSLSAIDLPVWAALVGAACSALYAVLCGRDFSFVGQFVLAWIVSSGFVAWIATMEHLVPGNAAQALAWNTAFLLYLVYDTASLLSRRRRGEALAAVVDLFRDVLNVLGWTLRVVQHWRQHRIWVVPGR